MIQTSPENHGPYAPYPNVFRTAMRRSRAPEPAILVIFGATGDLTKRKLIPAIFDLWQRNQLGTPFKLMGVGRQEIGDIEFAEQATKFLDDQPQDKLEEFRGLLCYEGGNLTEPAIYQRLALRLEQLQDKYGGPRNILFYLSTPPSLFQAISDGLGAAKLQNEEQGWRRIIIEKPFGNDLESARQLNKDIQAIWQEKQIFRIDHYLGKETVQNLMAIRFGNAIFEPIWNRSYVDHVQITAAEDLGLEGRAGYYENVGVVRDMLQNHLLQLFALTAMEPPTSSEADAIRDEKVKVLRSVRPLETQTVHENAVRGQYGAGNLYGEEVVSYRQEPDVNPHSMTPTYVALKLEINNWRWQGVPFFLRTGKRLPKKVTEIAVVFKRPPTGLFGHQDPLSNTFQRNVLAFRIQPDEGVSLKFSSKAPGQDMSLREVTMDFQYGSFGATLESPYSRLLMDALLGDATLFPRVDEVENAWQIVDPLLKVWDIALDEASHMRSSYFPNYKAGTWGPTEADSLMGKTRRWRRL